MLSYKFTSPNGFRLTILFNEFLKWLQFSETQKQVILGLNRYDNNGSI